MLLAKCMLESTFEYESLWRTNLTLLRQQEQQQVQLHH